MTSTTPSDWPDFQNEQRGQRRRLWSLLGDLPERQPPSARVVHCEQKAGYRLEHLLLDINQQQSVPALMLIPDQVRDPAPAVLYCHWHGGNYERGKEELLYGRAVLKPYADVFAGKGIVVLAIDSWCFGERRRDPDDGSRGEADTFKEMLWKGQCLFGMMLFDEWQALNYLTARPEVDETRIGTFGMSMGATKAWWLAALDERVRCCIDLCCLTDYDALMAHRGLHRHGLYYYVPGLLKHFSAAEINGLIVPRPRLSLNGRHDPLTPPEGVERIRDHLRGLYERYGRIDDCQIELFDGGHEELPQMRSQVLNWLDRYLTGT